MLDAAIVAQLREVLADLDHDLDLVVAAGDHPKRDELLEMVTAVAETSERINVIEDSATAALPQVALFRDGVATGVRFTGVPGGHEFTSLVVALLNAAGRGRLPDDGIQDRIRGLRGPIRLRTMVSLDCTNCPEVVQSLNLMALLHDDIEHEMVDGGLAPDEVERLGVQGVPAVVDGDAIVHVGKSTLADLLDQLSERFGAEVGDVAREHQADVAVIGGGPAGVAAAVYSARKGLATTLVAGRIGGQVLDTLGIENLPSKAYTEGPQLAADLRSHLESAGVTILENRAVDTLSSDEQHRLHLHGGEKVIAGQVVIATGAKWRELGVPGEREHLGHGVAYCPHCDGPFFKGKDVAVIGGGNSGIEAAIDLAGICSSVTVLEFGEALRADAVLQRKLESLDHVRVITSARTTEVVGEDGNVVGLRYEDRSDGSIKDVAVDGIFVQIGLQPNSGPFADHLDTTRHGEIVVDDRGRTSVPGIYAAGDVTTIPYKQIVIAMGEGAKVALAAFDDRIRAA